MDGFKTYAHGTQLILGTRTALLTLTEYEGAQHAVQILHTATFKSLALANSRQQEQVTHQGRQQVTAHQKADGDNEDRLIDLPVRGHRVRNHSRHHHNHQGQQREYDVHRPVVDEGGLQLHSSRTSLSGAHALQGGSPHAGEC